MFGLVLVSPELDYLHAFLKKLVVAEPLRPAFLGHLAYFLGLFCLETGNFLCDLFALSLVAWTFCAFFSKLDVAELVRALVSVVAFSRPVFVCSGAVGTAGFWFGFKPPLVSRPPGVLL